MVGSDLARMLIVLAMISAQGSVWLLLGLVLLEGIGKAFFETARIAAVPSIVRGHSIPSAVALFQSTNQTVNLLGPALAGLLLAAGSVTAVLAIDAVTFVVSAVLLGSMAVLREVVSSPDSREPYWRSLATGVRELAAIPSLRFLFLLLVPVMLMIGLFTTNYNAQLLTVFNLPALQFGLAEGIFGGGAVVGALLGPLLMRRQLSSQALMTLSIGLLGAAMLAVSPLQWLRGEFGLVAVYLWCLVTGLCVSLYNVPVANVLLKDLPEHLRGRGVGWLNAIDINFTVLGVILGGLLAGLLGVPNSILVAGGALLVTAIAVSALAFRQPSEAGAS